MVFSTVYYCLVAFDLLLSGMRSNDGSDWHVHSLTLSLHDLRSLPLFPAAWFSAVYRIDIAISYWNCNSTGLCTVRTEGCRLTDAVTWRKSKATPLRYPYNTICIICMAGFRSGRRCTPKCVRCGYSAGDFPSFSSLCESADDDKRFHKVLHNITLSIFCTDRLLPPVNIAASQNFDLWARAHDRQVPKQTGRLTDSNFIVILYACMYVFYMTTTTRRQ